MAGEVGSSSDNLTDPIDRLASNIGQFDFISALRWLDCAYPEKPRLGDSIRLSDESVRLSQSISLAFKGVALDSLEPGAGKHPHRLNVNFLGLLGTNGPLPLHYTEYADQRLRHSNDPTFKEFLDIFNHRMLSLFYRASTEFDPAVNFDRAENNRFDKFVGALAGLGLSQSKDRDDVPDYAKYFYAGWHGNKSKSPDGIKSIVGEYFDIPVDVEEFVGAWLDLPFDARGVLGGENGNISLGVSAYLGKRVWSVGHKFKVIVGPLDWQEYLSFRPGGTRAKELHDLVRNYVGDEWDWDLELRVEEGMIDPMQLDKSVSLGFSSWLVSKAVRREAQANCLNHSIIATGSHQENTSDRIQIKN